MARSLLRDCLIRLLSPVLCLDFSSQDRYHSVCCCALICWFLITFFSFLRALKFFRILFYFFFSEIWKLYQSNIETEIKAVSNDSRRSLTVWTRDFLLVFLNFSTPAQYWREVSPQRSKERDPGVICFPRSRECNFPRKLAGYGRLKDLQCYCICISKHQERHAVVKTNWRNK